MFGYTDNLCPPVSAKFSCSMVPLDCTPREEFRKVHSCDFESSELCQFTAMEGTDYAEDIAEFMEMDDELAEEYIKELKDIFAASDWDSELDWTTANMEWFYPGVDVMEEVSSEDGTKHDIEQFVGVCDDNIVYTNIFRVV